MHTIALFCCRLANQPSQAAELLNDAETLENESSRVGSLTTDVDFAIFDSTEFEISTVETLGVMSVSCLPSSLGIFTDVNAATLKMLGYNRRDIVGRNSNIVIPEPISSIHQQYLVDYMHTGAVKVRTDGFTIRKYCNEQYNAVVLCTRLRMYII